MRHGRGSSVAAEALGAVAAEGFGEALDDGGVGGGDVVGFRPIVGEMHEARAELVGFGAGGSGCFSPLGARGTPSIHFHGPLRMA